MKRFGPPGLGHKVIPSSRNVAFPTAVTHLVQRHTSVCGIDCGKITFEHSRTRRNFLQKSFLGWLTVPKSGSKDSASMDDYPPERQLVSEWYTPSLATTLEFLRAFGFTVLREEPEYFAELSWMNSKSRLMVEQIKGFVGYDDHDSDSSQPPQFGWRGYVANIRVLVRNVDSVYELAKRTKGATILNELKNKDYGLRDFTVGGPFGIALRFATPLAGFSE